MGGGGANPQKFKATTESYQKKITSLKNKPTGGHSSPPGDSIWTRSF